MNQENTIKDILEIVEFIRDHAASKEDLLQFATKEDLRQVEQRLETKIDTLETKVDTLETKVDTLKHDIINHIDGFIGLHQKLEAELIALHGKYQRLESFIQQLAKHVHFQLEK